MLEEYIQFCVVDFWFEFNCIKNSLQKNALETKMEKERIKRKEETFPWKPAPAAHWLPAAQSISPLPLSSLW